jgi:acetylornithine deacetylase/succinyl-diaminopimelate desuccinylase-like protein
MAAELERFVERDAERMVRDLEEFIRIPSVSTTGSDMTPAVAFLERALAEAGATCRVFRTEGNPIVYGEWGADEPALEVLVYGHYDVFPADDAEAWATPPFEPTIVGDRIFGRGAGDNKSQILAQIQGLRALRELGLHPPVRVKLLIEGEEEMGSRSLPPFVDEHLDLLRADLCFYSDGPMYDLDGDQPVLLHGVRGAVVFELRATGARRALHSGNFGGVAPTPALDLCRFFGEAVAPDGTLRIPGLAPAELPQDVSQALEALPDIREMLEAEMGTPPVDGDSAKAVHERLLCRHFFNLAGFSAGRTGEGIRPAIPHEATAMVDIRLAGDQDPDEVMDAIGRFLERPEFERISIRQLVRHPPSRTPLDHPFAEALRRAVEQGFGRAPLPVPGLAATTPEHVFTRTLGMPTVNAPYAPQDESNHAPNESTKLSLYLGGVRTIAYVIQELARDARDRGRMAVTSGEAKEAS